MDKKNVQFSKTEIFYEKRLKNRHSEHYALALQKIYPKFVTIFFKYFKEKDLGIFFYFHYRKWWK